VIIAVFVGIIGILARFYGLSAIRNAVPEYYFVLGLVFTFGIIRFVVFRNGMEQLLVLERRPVEQPGFDYNDISEHYYKDFINKILIPKHKCEPDQNKKYDCYI
jgi:hypothetical protein